MSTSFSVPHNALPIISLGNTSDLYGRIDSRPFVDDRAQIGSVTVDVSRKMAEIWFTPEGSVGDDNERIRNDEFDVSLWLKKKGDPSPTATDATIGYLVGLSLPSEHLVRPGRTPTFTLRYDDLRG